MKTEEIKVDEFTERIEKAKSDMLQVKKAYTNKLKALVFIVLMLFFQGTYVFNVAKDEEGFAQGIAIFGVVILVLIGIYLYQENKHISRYSNVVMNMESIYLKKQTLEESLGILKEIHYVMKNTKFIAELLNLGKGYSEAEIARGITTDDFYRREGVLQKEFIELLLGILYDLREDMIASLRQNETTLTQAKAEVSTHVNGTNMLNQVSEVQVVRLDKQIERFQELQRVLEARK